MDNPIQNLKICEQLTDKSKWTKGEFARDVFGNPVSINSESATSRCLSGWIHYCYGDEDSNLVYTNILKAIQKKINQEGIRVAAICYWNDFDTTTFEDVKSIVTELNY